jgi:hypothetical protein
MLLVCAIRGFRWKASQPLAQIALGLAVLGIVLKVLPWFYELNWEMIAFALPAQAGLAGGLFKLRPAPVAVERRVIEKEKRK